MDVVEGSKWADHKRPALPKSAYAGGAANMLGVSPNADNSKYAIPLEAAPSTRQGFGRIALYQTLPLQNSTFRLQARPRPAEKHSTPLLPVHVLCCTHASSFALPLKDHLTRTAKQASTHEVGSGSPYDVSSDSRAELHSYLTSYETFGSLMN